MSRSISRSSFDARSSRAGGSLAMIDTVVDEFTALQRANMLRRSQTRSPRVRRPRPSLARNHTGYPRVRSPQTACLFPLLKARTFSRPSRSGGRRKHSKDQRGERDGRGRTDSTISMFIIQPERPRIFRGPHFGKTNSTPKKDDKSEGLRALRRVSWARTCDKANLVRPGAVLERAQTAELNENI